MRTSLLMPKPIRPHGPDGGPVFGASCRACSAPDDALDASLPLGAAVEAAATPCAPGGAVVPSSSGGSAKMFTMPDHTALSRQPHPAALGSTLGICASCSDLALCSTSPASVRTTQGCSSSFLADGRLSGSLVRQSWGERWGMVGSCLIIAELGHQSNNNTQNNLIQPPRPPP